MTNDLIGQLLTLLSNDPHITVISDNNPATGTTARVIVLQKAGCQHYIKITPSSKTAVGCYLLKLDHSTVFASGNSGFISNCPTFVVYSSNILAVHFVNTSYSTDFIFFIDSSGMFWGYSFSVGGWTNDADDASHTFWSIGSGAPSVKTDLGNILSIPIIPVDASTGKYYDSLTVPQVYQFNISQLALQNNNVYVDPNGQYGYYYNYLLYHE
jgi:hypothetical protein